LTFLSTSPSCKYCRAGILLNFPIEISSLANKYRDNHNLTHDKDVQEKASNIIPCLSSILEGKYGLTTWEWFLGKACDHTTGFHYDPATEKIGS
jgi:hypothetical protein